MILNVTNLKGGTSKTTTAAYLAHALAACGRRVLVVDSDEQRSITRWAELAHWDVPVRGMASGRLHVPGVGVDVEAARVDDVVIDTPPTERDRAIVESAVRAATHVVIPVAPTSAEFERMDTVSQLIADVACYRDGGRPPATSVLLTRTVANTHAVGEYRAALERAGWRVHRPTVAFRQRFAQAWGGPVDDPLSSAYGDVVHELLEGERRRLQVAG